jgi:hypothetical protein
MTIYRTCHLAVSGRADRIRPALVALLCAGLAAGCEDKDSGPRGGGGPDYGDDGSDDSTADDGGDDGGDKWDIGGGTGTGNGGDEEEGEYCKVDFVFVIDSSPSMADEQAFLLASFPGFIAAIEAVLGADDFNLMVLDAGQMAGAGCEGTLGSGRTTSAAGQDCALVGGNRYATQAQPDLTAAFTCMASRGQVGPSNEQTMQSLMDGIGPLTDPGGCNEGFVRDDAILVITIITDEEDDPNDINLDPLWDGTCEPADDDTNSTGDPQSWYDGVVAIKNGDPKAAVVLSLIGDCDDAGTCAGIVFDPLNPTASTGAEPSPRLREFTNMFEFGSIGPVCAPDYAPFFEEAVSIIDVSCDEFEPPG